MTTIMRRTLQARCGAAQRAYSGMYTFDMNWSANGTIPADAVAVDLDDWTMGGVGKWELHDGAEVGGPYSALVRSHTSGVAGPSGIVNLDANGGLRSQSGANTTAALLRIVGY